MFSANFQQYSSEEINSPPEARRCPALRYWQHCNRSTMPFTLGTPHAILHVYPAFTEGRWVRQTFHFFFFLSPVSAWQAMAGKGPPLLNNISTWGEGTATWSHSIDSDVGKNAPRVSREWSRQFWDTVGLVEGWESFHGPLLTKATQSIHRPSPMRPNSNPGL